MHFWEIIILVDQSTPKKKPNKNGVATNHNSNYQPDAKSLTLMSWSQPPDQGNYEQGRGFPQKPEWEVVGRGRYLTHAVEAHSERKQTSKFFLNHKSLANKDVDVNLLAIMLIFEPSGMI